MAVRTIENCNLIKKYGRPNIYDGKCEGYGGEDADEPCEVCKECKLNTCYQDNK